MPIFNIQYIKTTIGIFVLGLSFHSCTENIQLPLDNSAPLLCVEGEITSDTMAHTVKLSLSNDFYSNSKPIAVTGAVLIISEGENTYNLIEDSAGVYKTDAGFFALPNKTYRLDISNVDINNDGIKELYWAESSSKDINPLDSIAVKTYLYFQTKRDLIHITGFFQEDANVENYYMAKLLINDTLISDTITNVFYAEDSSFNGIYFSGELPIISLDQAAKREKLADGDKLTMDLYSISKDYCYYLSELSMSRGSNPFMGSPANVRTNIYPKANVCGYFNVAIVKHASMIYQKPAQE